MKQTLSLLLLASGHALAVDTPPADATTLYAIPRVQPPAQASVTCWHNVTPNTKVDLDAAVITVMIHGKPHRFVGGKDKRPHEAQLPEYEEWRGSIEVGSYMPETLYIFREKKTGNVRSLINLPNTKRGLTVLRSDVYTSTSSGPITWAAVTETRYSASTKKGRIFAPRACGL